MAIVCITHVMNLNGGRPAENAKVVIVIHASGERFLVWAFGPVAISSTFQLRIRLTLHVNLDLGFDDPARVKIVETESQGDIVNQL